MTSEPMTSPAEDHPATTVTPAEPEASPEKARDPRELLTELRSRFEVFRTFQPLAIGIDKSIRSHFPEADRKTLRIALSMHTHCNRYLRLLAKAEQRFDLDGQAVAEVSEEHRQFATTTLAERMQRQGNAQTPRNPEKQNARPPRPPYKAAAKEKYVKANGGEGSAPANGEIATPSGQEQAKAGNRKRKPERKPQKKQQNGSARGTVAETKTPPPASSAGLAEKLALLSEKFARK